MMSSKKQISTRASWHKKKYMGVRSLVQHCEQCDERIAQQHEQESIQEEHGKQRVQPRAGLREHPGATQGQWHGLRVQGTPGGTQGLWHGLRVQGTMPREEMSLGKEKDRSLMWSIEPASPCPPTAQAVPP